MERSYLKVFVHGSYHPWSNLIILAHICTALAKEGLS